MKEDYFNILIKDIIENNDKEKAIETIANKLNEKQLSSEEELLKKQWKEQENLKPTKYYPEDYVEELQERIDKAIEYIDRRDIEWGSEEHDKLLSILKGEDKE